MLKQIHLIFWLTHKFVVESCKWHDRWGKEWMLKCWLPEVFMAMYSVRGRVCCSEFIWGRGIKFSFIAFMSGTVRWGWQCGGSCQLGCSQGGVCCRALWWSRVASAWWIWCCSKVLLKQICTLLLSWQVCDSLHLWYLLFSVSLWEPIQLSTHYLDWGG